jgi:hypothetical protein
VLFAAAFVSVVFQAIGVWASVLAIAGAGAGFVALITGQPRSVVIEEVTLGAVAAFPTGFLLFVAAILVLG